MTILGYGNALLVSSILLRNSKKKIAVSDVDIMGNDFYCSFVIILYFAIIFAIES